MKKLNVRVNGLVSWYDRVKKMNVCGTIKKLDRRTGNALIKLDRESGGELVTRNLLNAL